MTILRNAANIHSCTPQWSLSGQSPAWSWNTMFKILSVSPSSGVDVASDTATYPNQEHSLRVWIQCPTCHNGHWLLIPSTLAREDFIAYSCSLKASNFAHKQTHVHKQQWMTFSKCYLPHCGIYLKTTGPSYLVSIQLYVLDSQHFQECTEVSVRWQVSFW